MTKSLVLRVPVAPLDDTVTTLLTEAYQVSVDTRAALDPDALLGGPAQAAYYAWLSQIMRHLGEDIALRSAAATDNGIAPGELPDVQEAVTAYQTVEAIRSMFAEVSQ